MADFPGRPRKLIAEVVGDVETVRVEVDMETRRLTVWVLRLDQEEPWRHEVQLVEERG